ncbi:hypothetical protein GIB67_028114 [Kingdonia uniflora]|uniref:Pentatricopeptide repeat-containing protein n=1 Tax=Kingdonia uniflora TaxID=39325 RepID=A0A7J7MNW6_9MAGN|nr:hypothetical protein GIB67_028114 [Kingdonia uniflora]
MNLLPLSPTPLNFTPFDPHPLFSTSPPSSRFRKFAIVSAVLSPEKKSRRKKQTKKDDLSLLSSSSSLSNLMSISAAERGLRLTFMEELMERARSRDVVGVSQVMYDMIAAGITPGPRSFHGLIVSHTLTGDDEGAMQSLRRELSAGVRPLHETFVALIRLFGSKGRATRGLEILAAMEKLNFDIRQAWLVLVDSANKVFMKGAKGGLRATDDLYDLLIEEDCKSGDHSNALTIAYEMEAAGRAATTFISIVFLVVRCAICIEETFSDRTSQQKLQL